MDQNYDRAKSEMQKKFSEYFSISFFLLFFILDCNNAKPINIDTSSPVGLGAFALEEIIVTQGGLASSPCGGQCVIFASSEYGSKTPSGNLGGIVGADTFCQSAASLLPSGFGDPSEYKALIMSSGGIRDLTHDWVLHPNTTYLNPENNNTISTDSNAMFQFPIGNTFSSNTNVWSAIDATGTTWVASSDDCANWTSSSFPPSGRTGWTGIVRFVDLQGNSSCNNFNSLGLFCVRF
ncbi:DUF1554 domain-containing protein [Leptospira sp. SA-E8]|uniref:DUF1554 domain-containing protein n=1 Tax=Leptospira sp. SA-E8 TaxID=3422259 RepID=UPI003EBB3F8F